MKYSVISDMVFFAGLCIVSLTLGAGINLVRGKPLAWRYDPNSELLKTIATNPAKFKGLEIVGVERAQKFFEDQEGLILDARPSLFYQLGHIKGAKNLSRKKFEEDRNDLAEFIETAKANQSAIMIYCVDIHCPDAGHVAEKLLAEGLTAILVYKDG